METQSKKPIRKPQSQSRPGKESLMKPKPVSDRPSSTGSGKLTNKIALITGGDSGIGRAVAIAFAKEGADVAVSYLNEHEDARETKALVEQYGRQCLLIPGDLSKETHCKAIVAKAIKAFEKIDVLVNNAAVHFETKNFEEMETAIMKKTFETNVYPVFWVTKYVLPYMDEGSAIISTSSVTAYRGSKGLVDYAATKAAILGFTRSLSTQLIERGIRVNAVAPGPIWTPLIPASFEGKRVAEHGSKAPMKRAGEPAEVAPAYVYLACEDSSYVTGQVIHPNGGEIVNG